MRFVLAIVATVIAAVLILLGLGQRTVWAPPDAVSTETALSGSAEYAVIGGGTLTANPGRQTLTVEGAGPLFVAYAPTADVEAWIGESPFDRITAAEGGAAISSRETTNDDPIELADDVAAADAAIVDPAGSDLWLEQFTGTDSLTVSISVPAEMSVIIASNGTDPAPTNVSLSWPLDDSTPLAGPLLAGGGLALLLGLILYIWAFVHLRRQRGPRRKGPQGKLPKAPRSSRYRPGGQAALGIAPKGRGARRGFVVVPVLLVTALGLSACSSDYWPDLSATSAPATATPTATPGGGVAETTPPVVTTAQAEEIVARVSEVAAAGDAARDAAVLEPRFTGAALELRRVNYAVRAALDTYAAPQAIPASPLSLVLPQATTTWPRVLTTVVRDEADQSRAPIALIMTQASPRANYVVQYAISLEANAQIPDVAPASVGTSIVAPDSKLMLLAPELVSTAYADILLSGASSQYADLFDSSTDTLLTQIGPDKKLETRANLPTTASIDFTNGKGSGPEIALATNDSGALVAASVNETSTVKPVEAGATVSTDGGSKALLGVESSTTGIVSTYGHQLLFYVPPIGSKEKIVLLGYSEGLVSAVQLP